MENRSMNRPLRPSVSGHLRNGKAMRDRIYGGKTVSHTIPKDSPCPVPAVCPALPAKNREMYEHADHMEPAMAYVPCQEFTNTYDLCYALNVGTIFPQLCKPFCGKRGARR